jgi:hypothetical protein
MRHNISRLITTGRHRFKSLAKEIRNTSKEISFIFDKSGQEVTINKKHSRFPSFDKNNYANLN